MLPKCRCSLSPPEEHLCRSRAPGMVCEQEHGHIYLGPGVRWGRCVCVHRSVVSDSARPLDCIPPVFSVHGSLQTRRLEWAAISFSRGSPPPRG